MLLLCQGGLLNVVIDYLLNVSKGDRYFFFIYLYEDNQGGYVIFINCSYDKIIFVYRLKKQILIVLQVIVSICFMLLI